MPDEIDFHFILEQVPDEVVLYMIQLHDYTGKANEQLI
jgi:hypothetical protein